MKTRYVAVEVDGELSIHLPGSSVGCWLTLCGLAGADEFHAVAQYTAEVPPGRRVDCRQCCAIWKTARGFKARDFDVSED